MNSKDSALGLLSKHARNIRAACVCSLALLTGSCASGPDYGQAKQSIPPLASGMGRIVVYRIYNFVGGATPGVVALNGELAGKIPAGGFFYVDLAPGAYVIDVMGRAFGIHPVGQQIFVLRPGQVENVRVTMSTRTALELVTADVAAGDLPSVAFAAPSAADIVRSEPEMAGIARKDFEAYKLASGMDFAARSSPGSPGTEAHAPPAPASTAHAESTTAVGADTPAPPLAPGDKYSDLSDRAPDDAILYLSRELFPKPSGLYADESEFNFNVLDDVTFDASTGGLSLVGHWDPAYSGPRIPYLQYLATLLESPKPEFTLTLTRDSSERVDELFNRTMSREEGGRISEAWGKVTNSDGTVSEVGKYMLPAMGINPIVGGFPGYLGAQLAYAGVGTVRVTAVEPGSPAEEAGLKAGMLILRFNNVRALFPDAVAHMIRVAGFGAEVPIQYYDGNMALHNATVMLGESKDTDIWEGITRYDVGAAVYRASNMPDAANVISAMGRILAVQDQYASDQIMSQNCLYDFFDAMGILDQFNALKQKGMSGAVSPLDNTYAAGDLFANRLEQVFNLPQGCLDNTFRSSLGGNPANFGAAISAIFAVFDSYHVPRFEEVLNKFIFRPEGLQIAPELVEKQFHVHPVMYPEYLGIPGDSQLARLMFEADYTAKRLINNVRLADDVKGFETSFGFERSHPQFIRNEAAYHLWISVDRMETRQSPGAGTLQFRDVRMRFNVRELGADGQDLPNAPGGYEDLLTRLYDPISKHYPVFHEVQEAAKVAAAAKWIQMSKPGFRLPAEGRVPWKGPVRMPGLVYIYMYPDEAMHTHVHFIAAGGVSLVPFPQGYAANPFADDSSVVDLRQSSSDVVRLLRSPGDPDGSPVGYETVRISPVELQASAAEAQQVQDLRFKVTEAREMLQQLADIDSAVRDLGAGDPDSMRQLQELQERRKEMRSEFDRYAASAYVRTVNDVNEELGTEANFGGSDNMAMYQFVQNPSLSGAKTYLGAVAPGQAGGAALDPKVLDPLISMASNPATADALAHVGDLGTVQYIAQAEKGYAALDDVIAYKAGSGQPESAPAVAGRLEAFEGQLSAEAVKALNDPDMKPIVEQSPGTDTDAFHQLMSAAATADQVNKGGKGDFTANFDAGTAKYAGTLPVPQNVAKYGAEMADEVSGFSDKVKNDPDMKAALGHLEDVRKQREAAQAELSDLVNKRNKADAATMPALNDQVDKKQAEYQQTLKDLSDTDDKIKKLRRHIDTTRDDAPAAPTSVPTPAPAQSPSPAAGVGTPSA